MDKLSSSQSLFSPVIVIGHIRIGTVQGASCVNLGNNWPSGFESHSKTNQGFGNVSGDRNIVRDARSYLQDSDLIDMMDAVADEVFPDWAKEMLSKTARVSNDHNREAPE